MRTKATHLGRTKSKPPVKHGKANIGFATHFLLKQLWDILHHAFQPSGLFEFRACLILVLWVDKLQNHTLVLTTTGLDPNNTGLYFQANNLVNGGAGNAFGDGLRCAGGGLIRLQIRTSDGNGVSSTTIAIGAKGGVMPGDVKRYQCWYRDTSGSQPCGVGANDFNLSNGYEVTWIP